MTIAKAVLTGVAALAMCSAAVAQEDLTGIVTMVDRVHGAVAIQQVQSGTVGTNATPTTGPTEQFKTQAGLSLDAVHAGDRVSYAVTDSSGTKTVTKLQRQTDATVIPPVKQPPQSK